MVPLAYVMVLLISVSFIVHSVLRYLVLLFWGYFGKKANGPTLRRGQLYKPRDKLICEQVRASGFMLFSVRELPNFMCILNCRPQKEWSVLDATGSFQSLDH